MRQIKNQAAAFATLAALAGLASCSDDDTPETDLSSAADAGSSPSATPDPDPDPDYTLVSTTHLTGPGRWAIEAVGDPEAPLAVIDVPSGYEGRESYVWTHDELDLAVNQGQVLYLAPTRVYADPCDPERPSPRLGPSVEDLAEALAAQRLTTTTRPVATSLDGYSGLYLELTTSESVDFKACTDETMVIFESGRGAERVFEFPSTERYWILDVEGRRVVITAMTPSAARGESVKRVTDVAEGVTFADPEA